MLLMTFIKLAQKWSIVISQDAPIVERLSLRFGMNLSGSGNKKEKKEWVLIPESRAA